MRFEKVRRIDIAGLAICGGLTLLALLEVIQPHVEATEAAAAQRVAMNGARTKTTELISALELSKKRLHSFQQTIDTGPYKLQSATQINQRLVELTDLATQEGLTIRNLQPGAVTTLPRYEIVQIDLSGLGSYHSAASFLHRLHEVFKDMGVRSFQLSVEQSEGGNLMMYRFNLSWYVRASDKG